MLCSMSYVILKYKEFHRKLRLETYMKLVSFSNITSITVFVCQQNRKIRNSIESG